MFSIYYTSGTSGRPKGIASTREAVGHFIEWQTNIPGLAKEARVSHLTGPGFDAALRDIFTPLSVGGTICAPADRNIVLDPIRLADWLCRSRVSTLHTTPSVFRTLRSAPNDFSLNDLRFVFLAGEVLSVADVRNFHARFGTKAQIINMYGPSETTMTKLFHFIQVHDLHGSALPIGGPLPGVNVSLIDEKGSPSAEGSIGEIRIHPPFGLAGYFHGDPDGRFGGKRADGLWEHFRTGDFGRRRPDGTFEFLGRKDGQVKIRGMRVELHEIESALRAVSGITDAAVVARDDSSGNAYLSAYLAGAASLNPEHVRHHLSQTLPDYMLPSSFVRVDAIPRTLNGKVDRRALPADPNRILRPPVRHPRNAMEEKLSEIWSRLLGISDIGIDDPFFLIGGYSLLAARLLADVRTAFGRNPSLADFFAQPTIAGMADWLTKTERALLYATSTDYKAIHSRADQSLFAVGENCLVPLRTEGRRPPLVLIHPTLGNVYPYMPLLPHLPQEHPVYALQHPRLIGQTVPKGFRALAAKYAEVIRSEFGDRSLVLGGWSLGGTLAHAVGCCFEPKKQQETPLLLIDAYAARNAPSSALLKSLAHFGFDVLGIREETQTPNPMPAGAGGNNRWSSATEKDLLRAIDLIVNQIGLDSSLIEIDARVLELAAVGVAHLMSQAPAVRFLPVRFLRFTPRSVRTRMLIRLLTMGGYLDKNTDTDAVKILIELFCENTAALQKHFPDRYGGPAAFFESSESADEDYGYRTIWEEACASLRIFTLGGHHYDLLREPGAAGLGSAIRGYLDSLPGKRA